MQLKDRVALITGAGSGIGAATARLMAAEGARVGVLSRTASEVERVAAEIAAAGGEALALTADVSQPDQMQAAVEQLAARFGRIDIVFANAGINGVWAALEDITPEEWDRTLDINLKGTFLSVKYALPYLKRQGGAVIVNASVNGTRIFSNTGATAYSCSKAAQVAFTKMVALELAPHRIRVNAICPGWITSEIGHNTERRGLENIRIPVEYPQGKIPLTGGKPGRAEQVAQLVLFLASDAASHVTGTEMWIDGAESLIMG